MKVGNHLKNNRLYLLVFLAIAFAFDSYSTFAAPEIQNEKKITALKNGKKLFEKHLCVDCHKGGGNALRPGKPIKGKKFQAKYKDDKKLSEVIRKGNPQKGMPAFSVNAINDNDLKDLILYVRTLGENKSDTRKTKE